MLLLIFILSITNAEAKYSKGDAVVVFWAGKKCTGTVREVKSSGEMRVKFEAAFCGDPLAWYQEKDVRANVAGSSIDGIGEGSSILTFWGGFNCSGKVVKIHQDGLAQINYDHPNCGDPLRWKKVSELKALTRVQEISKEGKVFSKGIEVGLTLGGKTCAGKVAEISDSGFMRVEYPSEYCGNSEEWREWSAFHEPKAEAEEKRGVASSVEDENPMED